MGVWFSTMGCLQATEVIKILLGKDGIASGRVLLFDALKMKFCEVGLARQPDRETITSLIDYQGFCAGPNISKAATTPASSTAKTGAETKPTSFDLLKSKANPGKGRTMDEVDFAVPNPIDTFHCLQPNECLEKLDGGWTPWVLDVRLKTEHDIVALPFTDKVSPHRTVRLDDVPRTGDILVYCKAGVRGKKACNRLIELGVEPERLFNLEGGIMRWQMEVDPSLPRY
jgi:adenylyltransferase/sulfurtransferase